MQSVLVDRKVLRLNLEFPPRNLEGKAGEKQKKKQKKTKSANIEKLMVSRMTRTPHPMDLGWWSSPPSNH